MNLSNNYCDSQKPIILILVEGRTEPNSSAIKASTVRTQRTRGTITEGKISVKRVVLDIVSSF